MFCAHIKFKSGFGLESGQVPPFLKLQVPNNCDGHHFFLFGDGWYIILCGRGRGDQDFFHLVVLVDLAM